MASKNALSCLTDAVCDKIVDRTLLRTSPLAFVIAGCEAVTEQIPSTAQQYCLAGARIVCGGRLVGEVDADEVMGRWEPAGRSLSQQPASSRLPSRHPLRPCRQVVLKFHVRLQCTPGAYSTVPERSPTASPRLTRSNQHKIHLSPHRDTDKMGLGWNGRRIV